jgi:hypothetical protein
MNRNRNYTITVGGYTMTIEAPNLTTAVGQAREYYCRIYNVPPLYCPAALVQRGHLADA